jgi:hypothetical protein
VANDCSRRPSRVGRKVNFAGGGSLYLHIFEDMFMGMTHVFPSCLSLSDLGSLQLGENLEILEYAFSFSLLVCEIGREWKNSFSIFTG